MRFKKAHYGIYEDQETGLQWTKTFDGMNWKEAMDFCENLKYGRYSDWRLATINELISLIDYQKYNPATDIPDTRPSSYWSSTTDADLTDIAWYVSFDYGSIDVSSKSSALYVRAVRGGQY